MVILAIGIATVEQVFDTAIEVEQSEFNNSEIILSNSGVANTLEQGVSTLGRVAVKNQTWLYSTGDITNDPYINLTDDAEIKAAGNMTVSMWIEKNLTGGVRFIMANNANDNQNIGFRYSIQSDGLQRVKVGNGATTQTVDGTTNVTIGGWHHVAFTFDSAIISIYGEGLNESNGGLAGQIGTPVHSVVIGTRYGATGASVVDSFNGSIDEVRIYNESLTSGEINEIYNFSREGNATALTDNLVYYGRLNENQGTTAFDSSPTASNGTIIQPDEMVWTDDGINLTLTRDVDFSVSGTTFTIINQEQAYKQMNITYNFLRTTTNNTGNIIRLIGIFSALAILSVVMGFVVNSLIKK